MTVKPDRIPMPSSAQTVLVEVKSSRPQSKTTAKLKIAEAEPPVVPVSQPVAREVTNYVDYTARTEAIYTVDIRPRVTGYLVQMPFQEGAEVKQGDLLFVVDRRPYKAQLDQAEGQVDLYRASLQLAKTTLAGIGPSTRSSPAPSASSSSIRNRPW